MMQSVLTALGAYKYLILIVAACIEGPIVMMVSGALLRTGDLLFVPTYLSLMFGDLLGDTAWYALGYYGGDAFVKRYGHYVSVTVEKAEAMKRAFQKYHEPILILSKMTMGLGFALATLMGAGLAKIPLKKFLAMNAIGQVIWSGMLLAVGYYLGNFYLTLDSILAKISLFAFIVVVFLLFAGFNRYLGKRLTEDPPKK